MKIYDKEIYKSQENMKVVVIIIVSFLLGFFAGYFTNTFSHPVKEENVIVQNETSSFMQII